MVGTLALGVAASRGRDADLAEWSVGGRSFGAVLTWVLLAGESYTSFSYLGAAGWAYGYGAPILYLVGYLATGYATVYLFAPMVWGYAKRHNLISLSDILAHRFGSPRFGIVVAAVATIALLPYIQLQIQGMGLVVTAMSFGEIGLKTAFVVGFVVATGFVLVSGLRGSAWVSVLKDSLVILTVAFLAVYLPVKLFGGYGDLFGRLRVEKPEWLTLPGHDSPGLGVLWFMSTCLLNGVTYIVFPSFVAGYLGSRSANTIRRNAIFLPLYSVLLLVPIMLGLAALFVVPSLENSDLALLTMVTRELPGWVVGIVGVAGALSAIVPMAVFMLCIGTLWGTRSVTRARVVVVAAGLAALAGALLFPDALVRLSVLSYEGIAQFVPALVGGLLWRRMTTAGALAGLIAGVAIVAPLALSGHDPFLGLNAGLLGLVVNLAVNVAVSRARPGAPGSYVPTGRAAPGNSAPAAVTMSSSPSSTS
ncbi:MAG TPA: sodium:solute symporter family protein [Solirubrobacter sp.]|nr:sodium:solute symporter family protein [Solirubrobacter sp.]